MSGVGLTAKYCRTNHVALIGECEVERVRSFSLGVARMEMAVAAILAVAIAVLILVNVITRSIGQSVYWVDEAAIAAMVWMTFLGSSAAIHYRTSVAVTILPDMLNDTKRLAMGRFVDLVSLGFALFLAWVTVLWFDPANLVAADFSLSEFSGSTFNFIYEEQTTTLGFRKFWLWLIVPIFCLTVSLHALVNLLSRPDSDPPHSVPSE